MHADTKVGMLGELFVPPAREPLPDLRVRGAERLTQEAEFNRYSTRIWIVLSIVMSLAITSIFVKHEMEGLSMIPVLVLPVSLTLYVKAHIARLGSWVYAGTLVVVLSVAVLFGL
jgi:hypothetical protein